MMTDYQILLAMALDSPEGHKPELAVHYYGCSLDGEPITASDLLLVARNSDALCYQLRMIHDETENMLVNVNNDEV